MMEEARARGLESVCYAHTRPYNRQIASLHLPRNGQEMVEETCPARALGHVSLSESYMMRDPRALGTPPLSCPRLNALILSSRSRHLFCQCNRARQQPLIARTSPASRIHHRSMSSTKIAPAWSRSERLRSFTGCNIAPILLYPGPSRTGGIWFQPDDIVHTRLYQPSRLRLGPATDPGHPSRIIRRIIALYNLPSTFTL
ncbi:hypothetical protein FA95DRAFT_694215 [Auriscalpium vulgare]|uniref:Uncharacterized protein n=1 Tax=Auriscalpium vulgare TaxID=40419 RepID=A0ACB8RBE6_9AGAM|nr:hypothetical protein FA95DRAFT_694215 [Auriscalpium vulgare]